MGLSDVRFIKGLLFGLLAQVEDDVWLSIPLALCAIGFILASIFSTTPTNAGGDDGR